MAKRTENYGLIQPDDTDFYNVQEFNENMDIIDEEIKKAGMNPQVEIDVGEIKAGIGTTADTGGSQTAGTVMGKLNRLIIDMIDGLGRIGKTNDPQGNSTSGTLIGKANYLCSQVASYLSQIFVRIGSTGDTGGSETSGTVMGKCNEILKRVFENQNKMAIPKSETKTCDLHAYGTQQIINVFDFDKPINFISLHADYKYSNATSAAVIFSVVINGIEIESSTHQIRFATFQSGFDEIHVLAVDGLRDIMVQRAPSTSESSVPLLYAKINRIKVIRIPAPSETSKISTSIKINYY